MRQENGGENEITNLFLATENDFTDDLFKWKDYNLTKSKRLF